MWWPIIRMSIYVSSAGHGQKRGGSPAKCILTPMNRELPISGPGPRSIRLEVRSEGTGPQCTMCGQFHARIKLGPWRLCDGCAGNVVGCLQELPESVALIDSKNEWLSQFDDESSHAALGLAFTMGWKAHGEWLR